jgi:HSP20 family protein
MVDRLFDDFMPLERVPAAFSGHQTPVDVVESEKDFVVKANVPGIPKDNLEIEIHEDTVVIRGKYDEQKESKTEGYRLKERHSGSFVRVLPLGVTVDSEKASAKIEDGVLVLTLPKVQPELPKAKRLQIQG